MFVCDRKEGCENAIGKDEALSLVQSLEGLASSHARIRLLPHDPRNPAVVDEQRLSDMRDKLTRLVCNSCVQENKLVGEARVHSAQRAVLERRGASLEMLSAAQLR